MASLYHRRRYVIDVVKPECAVITSIRAPDCLIDCVNYIRALDVVPERDTVFEECYFVAFHVASLKFFNLPGCLSSRAAPGGVVLKIRKLVMQPVGHRIGYVSVVWIVDIIVRHAAFEFSIQSVQIGGVSSPVTIASLPPPPQPMNASASAKNIVAHLLMCIMVFSSCFFVLVRHVAHLLLVEIY